MIDARQFQPPVDAPTWLRRLADHLTQFMREWVGTDVVHGVRIEDVSFTGGSTTRVVHKLGKKPRGYWVVRAEVAHPGLFVTVANWDARDSQVVTLSATTTSTADLWVF